MLMLKRTELSAEEMRELAAFLPGADPEVKPRSRGADGCAGSWRPIIPVCEPVLGGNEIEYVRQAIESNWISSAGGFTREFEAAFARFCGTRYGIACSSGTAAMHLMAASLGLESGDEVILPTFTMIATANAITYCGARPVLVDCEPQHWQMDVEQVAAKITPRTRAVMPVHIYGHPVDMDPLIELADRHGLAIIEDAAESHGARYKGRPVGGLGLAAGFSFYANKIVTTGEGGMVTTNDPDFARLAATLRDHAFSPERHFWHSYIGFNYRLSNLQAAVGLAQMEQCERLIEARRRNAAAYGRTLASIPGIRTPAEAPWASSVYWMYGILVDAEEYGLTRDQLRRRLAENGIETRSFFVPVHCQPVYRRAYASERFPVAERLCRDGLYLPSASSLQLEEIEYIAGVIRGACPGLGS